MSRDKTSTAVQAEYWNSDAQAFDAIYSGNKSAFSRFLDRYFRSDMIARFDFVMKHTEPIDGKVVLDLGCGSGRYSVALARRGARRVIGIDVAGRMLSMAKALAAAEGVSDRCEWIRGDNAGAAHVRADIGVAIGLFDYLEDPASHLVSMANAVTSRLIISFPRSNTWRAPVRKIRLGLKGCPVYFYSRGRVLNLLDQAGLKCIHFEQIGNLYLVITEHRHD